MGRRRREADKWMPPRVYRGRCAYEWRPHGGGTRRLCALNASREEVWAAYGAAKVAQAAAAQRGRTFADIMDLYFASDTFRERAARTQQGYRESARLLRSVFGAAAETAITAPVLRQYMDRRGRTSKAGANLERSLLGVIWRWGYERGLLRTRNPVPDVAPFRMRPRERYVSDAEYLAVYRRAPASVRAAMEISYLCAARQADVLDLRWGRPRQTAPEPGQTAVVLEQGVYIRQGKTGKRQIKLWTPRLTRALHRARINQGKVVSLYVVHTRDGQRYTAGGFRVTWRRARDQALAAGAIAETFTFHDIKAKSISDYEGDKQRFSGHQSRAQMERYNRKPESVTALDTRRKKKPE